MSTTPWTRTSLLLVIILCSPSCSPNKTAEDSFQAGVSSISPDEPTPMEQIEAVQTGTSHRILVSQRPVAESELERISELTELNELLLDAGVVNDSQLERLLPNLSLSHLRIRNSPITDVGLASIAKTQSKLRVLNLPQATLSATGLMELRNLDNLSFLRLGGDTIDDEAVEAISKIPNLQSLHLIGPKISARSLKTVAAMKNLGSFYLDDCPIADDAWVELFQSHPHLHIHVDQSHHDRDPARH